MDILIKNKNNNIIDIINIIIKNKNNNIIDIKHIRIKIKIIILLI